LNCLGHETFHQFPSLPSAVTDVSACNSVKSHEAGPSFPIMNNSELSIHVCVLS